MWLMTGDEVARLRAERDALLEHDVDRWLDRVRDEASAYRQFENSLSYRVTAPLRLAGAFVRRTRSDGLGDALGLAVTTIKNRVRR